jgi:ribosome-binding factor A
MVHFRRQRLGDQIRVELAELLLQEVRDPRLGFVTVTEVRMSPDLKHARVYVSIFGDEVSTKASLDVLDRARGFLRSRIGSRLEIRYVPELRFVLDETLDESDRIDALLEEAADGEENAGGQ